MHFLALIWVYAILYGSNGGYRSPKAYKLVARLYHFLYLLVKEVFERFQFIKLWWVAMYKLLCEVYYAKGQGPKRLHLKAPSANKLCGPPTLVYYTKPPLRPKGISYR